MPGCAEELVVHKRKIEDVRQWLQQRSTPSPRGGQSIGGLLLVSGTSPAYDVLAW